MSSISTISLVARREIKERARSKPYLVTTVVTLLIVLGVIIVPSLFGEDVDAYHIGSVGAGNQAVVETAVVIGTAGDEPGSGPSVEMDVVVYDNIADAEAALEDGEIDAALVDGSEVIVNREESFFGSGGPISLLQRAAGAIALEDIASENPGAAQQVVEILSTDTLDVRALIQSDEEGDGAQIVAYFGLLILYMAIILYGTWILTGVTEEKTNRVVEILISTIRPWQLLAGKILGIGFLALAQLLTTLLVAFVAMRTVSSIEIPPIGIVQIANLAIWFVLGFLLYAVLFGAAGSLVGRIEDAQSAAMPMTIFSVIGFFAGFAVLENPEGTVALATTLFPFTAPFVVPIRVALKAIPAWQYLSAIALTLAMTYLAVRAAGRIYAGGILKSGTKTKLRDAWRAADG